MNLKSVHPDACLITCRSLLLYWLISMKPLKTEFYLTSKMFDKIFELSKKELSLI